jgi:hypothetical protein
LVCPRPKPVTVRPTGPELFAWLALRRVHNGGVIQFEGHYYDAGRRVTCFLPDVFDQLIGSGLIALAEPDPEWPGQRRASLTCEGTPGSWHWTNGEP